jgi:hypothetical protein
MRTSTAVGPGRSLTGRQSANEPDDIPRRVRCSRGDYPKSGLGLGRSQSGSGEEGAEGNHAGKLNQPRPMTTVVSILDSLDDIISPPTGNCPS